MNADDIARALLGRAGAEVEGLIQAGANAMRGRALGFSAVTAARVIAESYARIVEAYGLPAADAWLQVILSRVTEMVERETGVSLRISIVSSEGDRGR